MKDQGKNDSFKWALIVVGYLALIGFIAYGFYGYKNLEKAFGLALEVNEALKTELENAEQDKVTLSETLEEKESIIENFSGQISSITSTVGTLEKLAATDEELLKKYSRVYFLNENYVPAKLTDIPEEHLTSTATNYLINADVWPFLRRLLNEAERDDVDLLIASAFRSFGTQGALNTSYKVTYGTGANQFSAEQGYSEHQLGTTVDFTSSVLGANFSGFAKDPAYEWLKDNAHRYGFTLSYPEGNTYYKYEPWHWRFVGVELATDLHQDGKHFYDLDQREIDKYLIKLFD